MVYVTKEGMDNLKAGGSRDESARASILTYRLVFDQRLCSSLHLLLKGEPTFLLPPSLHSFCLLLRFDGL
jgi:hypothetical protein